MLNYQKRFVKIASGLSAVMPNVALLPTAVFAAHHHHQPPRHYQPRYRQRYNLNSKDTNLEFYCATLFFNEPF